MRGFLACGFRWPFVSWIDMGRLGMGLMAHISDARVAKDRAQYGAAPQSRQTGAVSRLGHFPETCGQIKFMIDRLLGKQARIIEYK